MNLAALSAVIVIVSVMSQARAVAVFIVVLAFVGNSFAQDRLTDFTKQSMSSASYG